MTLSEVYTNTKLCEELRIHKCMQYKYRKKMDIEQMVGDTPTDFFGERTQRNFTYDMVMAKKQNKHKHYHNTRKNIMSCRSECSFLSISVLLFLNYLFSFKFYTRLGVY